ncbi:MAG: acetyltransferase [Myxococcota bacterium]
MKVVVFGVGDFAQVAHFYLKHDSPHEVVAHTVNREFIKEPTCMGVPVVPFEEITITYPPDTHQLFIAVAYSRVNKNRQELFEKAKALGYTMLTYVCSKAVTWPGLEVGEGSFIFENNVVQPFVRIGVNTVLWSGNHIGHHSTIGNHVFIASHVVISGNCHVGDNSFIGVNATLRDGITLGRECVVGAGTLLLKNAPDRAVFKGHASEPASLTSDQLPRI